MYFNHYSLFLQLTYTFQIFVITPIASYLLKHIIIKLLYLFFIITSSILIPIFIPKNKSTKRHKLSQLLSWPNINTSYRLQEVNNFTYLLPLSYERRNSNEIYPQRMLFTRKHTIHILIHILTLMRHKCSYKKLLYLCIKHFLFNITNNKMDIQN